MSDHRRVFAEHFKSHVRRRYPSSLFDNGKWIQGACEMYAADQGIDMEIVVGVANAEREPNLKIMDEMGVEEAWITEKESVSVNVKFYRKRTGDRLY